MRRSLALCAVLVVAFLGLGEAPAHAAGPELPSSDPFYRYTGPMAAVPAGTVLRSRTVTIAAQGRSTPVKATQLLYRTVGELGQPTVTVTTVIQPVPTGPVTRIVSWQMFYDALGSECDPSYTLQGGNASYGDASEEEALFAPYLAAGDTVVVPDYEGENLEWGAGREAGYDTLDSIRAAESWLKVAPTTTPVAMVGYSGGSIATEWAAELAPSYAPQLDLVGAAAGGVPVDFAHNLAYINGSQSWSGVIPAVLVGVARAYHLDLAQYLSPYGEKVTKAVSGGCINSFTGAYPGLTIQSLLKPQYQNFLQVPTFAGIIDDLIMSTGGTPKEPLLLGVGNADGTGDGVMVAADVEALAYTYCHRGVSVDFNEYKGDTHTQAAIPFEAQTEAFVRARLAGAPFVANCSSVGPGNSLAPVQPAQGGSQPGTTSSSGASDGKAPARAAPEPAALASGAATAAPAALTAGAVRAVSSSPGSDVTALADTGAEPVRVGLLGLGLVLDGALLVAAVRRARAGR